MSQGKKRLTPRVVRTGPAVAGSTRLVAAEARRPSMGASSSSSKCSRAHHRCYSPNLNGPIPWDRPSCPGGSSAITPPPMVFKIINGKHHPRRQSKTNPISTRTCRRRSIRRCNSSNSRPWQQPRPPLPSTTNSSNPTCRRRQHCQRQRPPSPNSTSKHSSSSRHTTSSSMEAACISTTITTRTTSCCRSCRNRRYRCPRLDPSRRRQCFQHQVPP